jgi:hypothetical protein
MHRVETGVCVLIRRVLEVLGEDIAVCAWTRTFVVGNVWTTANLPNFHVSDYYTLS